MKKSLLRIPYTSDFAAPTIFPAAANSLQGAVAALQEFLTSPVPGEKGLPDSTVVLTGAGLSVASGLADYRGQKGTYRLNKAYRPIYYHEFLSSHEARKRYWARSFFGWTTLHKARPNAGHYAVRDLGKHGNVRSVITQNVDSFHPKAHPDIPTLELHGYLRSLVCTSCHHEFPRDVFQNELARLNPAWTAFLAEALASGALETEDPAERAARGMRSNPDGDVDLPGAPYTTFRYPACQRCMANPPPALDGTPQSVEVDQDGAWISPSTAGILKPAVIMFGENIPTKVKTAAEQAVDGAGRMLVLATSLATYSAWRLAKRAKDRGMPVAIVNMGGVRGEETFVADLHPSQGGARGVRLDMSTEQLLPELAKALQQDSPESSLSDEPAGLKSEGVGAS
ncbi:NAD-dependent protein deacylase SIR4 [Cytospora mali]|uniref:NAD-dependent protein deacylase SIR4 n=1 Tax=Cytospora mali TaxID=578113 RepID=A0A194V488_CYTMA|nr:NAD-dependent protein deacylase SIR4 [Valsa mali var. pyri (nom. inval.)]